MWGKIIRVGEDPWGGGERSEQAREFANGL